jgi:hypothetical protein
MSRRVGVLGFTLAGLLLVSQALLFAGAARAAEMEIASADGPLTRIITSDTLHCQVAHREDEEFEFFPSFSTTGSCGTYLAMGETLYGPVGGSATQIPWTTISQQPVTGSGRSGDPFRLVTIVDGDPAAVRVEQTDSYVVGSQAYRTDVQLTNTTAQPLEGVLYRAGDCYLQGDDAGFVRVDAGAPACIVDPAEGRRIEQWLPITPGSSYYAGFFGTVWSLIGSRQPFPNTCECETSFAFDNGAGISWPVSLGPGQSATFSHETFFSPVGRGLASEPFRDSVPDPTEITLDPLVLAQTAIISAGVILLVPFPSALFNSTLEENYEEVSSWLAALRRRLATAGAALLSVVRGRIAARRGSAQPMPIATPGPEPHIDPETAPRDVWGTPLGIMGFVVLSAFLYAFLDPTFGFSLESLGTFLGLAVGLAVVLVAYGAPLMLLSRGKVGLTVRALPATLVVAAICVVVSRVADFQPGYMYGLIVGFFFAHGVSREHEGRAEAAATAVTLSAALVAWIGLALLQSGLGPSDGFAGALLGSATVTIVVAGLENAVFAMLPLRFLPGAVVYAWNRRAWLVLIGLGIFGFAHVLLNPAAGSGYLADTARTPFLTLVVLLVGFALASVAFWAYFRFRPQRTAPAQPPVP